MERGISLNSARSVLDHLSSDDVEVFPIYFDSRRRAYRVSRAQLYSNTPSDFDFKLAKTAAPLSEQMLVRYLKSVDMVFPAMHGQFGEDGEIQSFLEKHSIPFVGSGSASCKRAFDKFAASEFLRARGFFTHPTALLKIYRRDHREIIEKFFKEHNLKRAVVKPASGGSSIGVFSVSTPGEALQKAEFLFSKRMDTRVVMEPFASGTEFTAIILQNKFGLPVALPPTEIETDYTENQFFDFRRKYLPTRQVIWHCPPRFEEKVIDTIQAQAEQIFSLFGMRDFARFDGWVLEDGSIWFCDFNTVSGMEQNSFLFQQASRVGLSHAAILRHIVASAALRYGMTLPTENSQKTVADKRKPVNVLFGGDTSERQVSLMSGTNVWLKLRKSKKYKPEPYLLDMKGAVWRLPYMLALNHTVEEIAHNCETYTAAKAGLESFEKRTRLKLGLDYDADKQDFFEPRKMPLEDFLKSSEFVFNALHGGFGEDGTLQKMCDERGVKFNGPDERVSKLCMDKFELLNAVVALHVEGVERIPGIAVKTSALLRFGPPELEKFWKDTLKTLDTKTPIVKPRSDGCSTGVTRLRSSGVLNKYMDFLRKGAPFIPKNSIGNQSAIELPSRLPDELMFERFVETDILRVKSNELKHTKKTGWLEITEGVVQTEGKLRALNPSITVVESEVLSVEEKFQGGTGVNITPPPAGILKPGLLKKVKHAILKVASELGIEGYSRIDAFMNVNNGAVMIIEVNTLPGLTPSTVFYQQALAEEPPIFPLELLEIFIRNKGY